MNRKGGEIKRKLGLNKNPKIRVNIENLILV